MDVDAVAEIDWLLDPHAADDRQVTDTLRVLLQSRAALLALRSRAEEAEQKLRAITHPGEWLKDLEQLSPDDELSRRRPALTRDFHADIVQGLTQQHAIAIDALRAERNAWKAAVIEATVSAHIYRKKHEDDPRKAVNDLLCWQQDFAIADMRAERDALREAGEALIERWDSPLWKDVPATATYINRLRAALAPAEQPKETP